MPLSTQPAVPCRSATARLLKYDITIDQRGIVWLGTTDGLLRHDLGTDTADRAGRID